MGKNLRNALAFTSFAIGAASAVADPGVVTDYRNGQPTASAGRGAYGETYDPDGSEFTDLDHLNPEFEKREPGFIRMRTQERATPICTVTYPGLDGRTVYHTFFAQADGVITLNPARKMETRQDYCNALQVNEIAKLCQQVQGPYNQKFADIQNSSYAMSKRITLKSAWLTGVKETNFRRSRSGRGDGKGADKRDELDVYQEYMAGYTYPDKGRRLFNASVAYERRLEVLVAPIPKGTGGYSKDNRETPYKLCYDARVSEDKRLNCQCATAASMGRMIDMLHNSASVRDSLSKRRGGPGFNGKVAYPRDDYTQFGSAVAPKSDFPLGSGH